MKDVIVWIIWVVVIIAGVVSSANKAKKKREEAERTARRRAQQSYGTDTEDTYMPEPERRYSRKSLGEILEELANQQTASAPEPEFVEGRDYTVSPQELVYEEGRGSQRETAYTEGGRVTKDTVVPDRKDKVEKNEKDASGNENSLMKEVLGGEFDLRRAIIEAEIITPKYF